MNYRLFQKKSKTSIPIYSKGSNSSMQIYIKKYKKCTSIAQNFARNLTYITFADK